MKPQEYVTIGTMKIANLTRIRKGKRQPSLYAVWDPRQYSRWDLKSAETLVACGFHEAPIWDKMVELERYHGMDRSRPLCMGVHRGKPCAELAVKGDYCARHQRRHSD